eukprot:TRINITY_DN67182_c1_g1_i1.p1 TRINITY_DN67182_c1_g1~~TRINITY_DN67182_c1_g1_i1.p1  ORF type:complete len:221 (+),score=20.99 TRINITY_DN67182_c1_g1_i1:63-725(+)
MPRKMLQLVVLIITMLSVLCEHSAEDSLLEAVEENNSEHMIDLLTKGVDVNHRSPSGETALLASVRLGRDNLIPHLLHVSTLDIHHHEFQHKLPLLHYAAQEGAHTIVAQLIKYGCSFNEFDPDGMLPIHYAALGHEQKHLETVRTLAHYGANVWAATSSGVTANELAHWAPIQHWYQEQLLTSQEPALHHQVDREEQIADAALDEELWRDQLEELGDEF